MTPLLKDRVKLIKAMQEAQQRVAVKFTAKADNEIIDKIIEDIRKNENKHFLSLSKEQQDFAHISYAKIAEDQSNHNKRIKTTLRRYIRRNLEIGEEQMRDTILDEFGKHVVSELSCAELEKRISIYKGPELTEQYAKTKIASCMTGARAHYTEVYALNPDVCHLYKIKDECRALVWTADCGTKIIDMVYGYGHDAVQILSSWAEKKGFVNIRTTTKQYFITMKFNEFFPHIDCFVYGLMSTDPNNNTVILTNKNQGKNNVSFFGISGKFELQVTCKKCGYYDSGSVASMADRPREDGLCRQCAKKIDK